jgi:hypothetical protein
VTGAGDVVAATCDNRSFLIREIYSTYISIAENTLFDKARYYFFALLSKCYLEAILKEDDIVRFEEFYERD